MKNRDLIKHLQQFPDDIEIGILDLVKNKQDDSGDGSSLGVYTDFRVDEIVPDIDNDNPKKWVALVFTNY